MQNAAKPKARRFDVPIVIAILICVALAAPILALIVRSLSYQLSFRSFTAAISDATVYCYEQDSLRAELTEDTVRVGGDNAYLLYALFTDSPAKPRRTVPSEEPDVHLNYGNGATLDCWQVRLEESADRWYGVLWRFTDPEGKRWTYDTDDFGLQDVQRLVSMSRNEPW